mgnify:CR=1 FL=1
MDGFRGKQTVRLSDGTVTVLAVTKLHEFQERAYCRSCEGEKEKFLFRNADEEGHYEMYQCPSCGARHLLRKEAEA